MQKHETECNIMTVPSVVHVMIIIILKLPC